jgi:hypothetical protein
VALVRFDRTGVEMFGAEIDQKHCRRPKRESRTCYLTCSLRLQRKSYLPCQTIAWKRELSIQFPTLLALGRFAAALGERNLSRRTTKSVPRRIWLMTLRRKNLGAWNCSSV